MYIYTCITFVFAFAIRKAESSISFVTIHVCVTVHVFVCVAVVNTLTASLFYSNCNGWYSRSSAITVEARITCHNIDVAILICAICAMIVGRFGIALS